MTKSCIKCEILKDLNDFHKRKISKDGYKNICKLCCKKYDKEWNINNNEYSKKIKKELSS